MTPAATPARSSSSSPPTRRCCRTSSSASPSAPAWAWRGWAATPATARATSSSRSPPPTPTRPRARRCNAGAVPRQRPSRRPVRGDRAGDRGSHRQRHGRRARHARRRRSLRQRHCRMMPWSACSSAMAATSRRSKPNSHTLTSDRDPHDQESRHEPSPPRSPLRPGRHRRRSDPRQNALVIRAGHLVDVDHGKVLTDQAIRIEGDRITRVEPYSASAPSATRASSTGRATPCCPG